MARRAAVSTGARPMSATTTSPAWNRPGATWSPTLLAWNVTVSVALTAAPATSPVEASTPEGRSTATTGSPQALIRSISAAASGRGAPWKPVPNSASIDDVAPLDRVGLDGLAARLAQHPRRDPARRRRSSRRRRRRRTGARTGYTRIAS